MDFRTLRARFTAFVSDFLPESNLQLLFPLASFILFVGASSSWLPPSHTLYRPELQQAETDLGWTDLWFNLSSVALVLRYYVAILAGHLAFFASIVLWCLPVRNAARKFAVWVFLPLGLALVYFLFLVLIGRSETPSVLASPSQIIVEQLRVFPRRLAHLGIGFYVTLLGATLLAICVRAFSVGKISLPLRFRGQAPGLGVEPDNGLGRRIFFVLALSMLFSIFVLSAIEGAIGTSLSISAMRRIAWWPMNFSVVEWAPALLTAIVTVICAIIILRDDIHVRPSRISGKPLARHLAFAFLFVLFIVCLPRIVLNMIQGAPFFLIEYGSGGPVTILGFDVPQPFFWLLLVYPIALLEELVVRGRLQAQLTRRFGLKRAIFLAALLWWVLPLSYGIGPVGGPRLAVPGVWALFLILLYAVYSVPLGWLYARTNSVLPPAVMHGTILFFHKGSNFSIYYEHPALYWIELALLALAGWLLFKRYPPVEIERPSTASLRSG